jgi:putative toxin-antitoxin system antitoxin component (TIGR02293 family)
MFQMKNFSAKETKPYIIDEDAKMSIVNDAIDGVYAVAFDDVVSLSGYKKEHIADIMDTSWKTYSRYKKEHKRLDAHQSERLLKLKALFSFGLKVFGSSDAFRYWLQKPAHGLGGAVPIDIIKTSTGIDLTINELTNIAYGNLA